MNDTFRVKTNRIDLNDLSSYLSRSLTNDKFYYDPKKTKEENIDLIVSIVKSNSSQIDTFLTDGIKQIRNLELRKGLIRYLISVKYGIDMACVHSKRRYVEEVLDGCVLISCPYSTIMLTIDGKIMVPENRYRFRYYAPFIIGSKVHAITGTNVYVTDEQSQSILSSNGNEIIPYGNYRVSFGKDKDRAVKIWLNDIGYMLYPIDLYTKHYVKIHYDDIKENYGYTEWILNDARGYLYHLTLSDCYLVDESRIAPGELGMADSRNYDIITDCSFRRPEIYNSRERIDLINNATTEEIQNILSNTADSVSQLLGELHIVPVTKLDDIQF